MEEIKNKLKEFYLSLDKIKSQIEKANKKTNIFDILKIGSLEIRHSNFLSWLLTPNDSHGLGCSIVKKFLLRLYNNYGSYYDKLFNEIGSLCIEDKDFDSFNCEREYPTENGKYIDMIAYSQKEKIVIVIENKVFSGEHSNQLEEYEKEVNKNFADYKKLFVFLTPDMREVEREEDKAVWKSFGYQEMCDLIKAAVEERESFLEKKSLQYINDYLEIVRRDVMGENTELESICEKIYEEYKDVIDIINQHLPDVRKQMSAKARAKIIKSLYLLHSEREVAYIHFTTDKMRKMFGNMGDGSWCGDDFNDIVMFEIRNGGKDNFLFTCHLGPSENKELREKIISFANRKENKELFNAQKRNHEKYIMLHKTELSYKIFDSQWENVKETISKIEETFEKEFLK